MGASRTLAFSGCKLHSLGMADREKYPSELAERFQIRLPAGLRDRIKAYAERHGRSMNTEIVRVLENQFPEPWPIDRRIGELLELVHVLKGAASNESVDRLSSEIEETVRGIASGRVKGLDERKRDAVVRLWERLQDDKIKYAWADEPELDPEEEAAMSRSGTTEKIVDPFE